MQKAVNFNDDVGIVSIKGSDYRIHFWYMSKDDAINVMKKVDHSNFFIIYKNEWNNLLSQKQRCYTK